MRSLVKLNSFRVITERNGVMQIVDGFQIPFLKPKEQKCSESSLVGYLRNVSRRFFLNDFDLKGGVFKSVNC